MSATDPAAEAAPELSIVVPAYREGEILEDTARTLLAGLRDRAPAFELIVVENGSPDDTAAVADRIASTTTEVRALHLPDADYGAALRAGILGARGDIVVCFDADYYDLAFLDAALALLGAPGGPAIVVGSKRAAGSDDTRSWSRRFATAALGALLQRGFRLPVSDTHGMKAMRAGMVRPHAEACESTRDLFDTELVLRAARAGLGVAELPVRVAERRPARTPLWRRVPPTMTGLVRLRRRVGRVAAG